jgi:hypothetical protein
MSWPAPKRFFDAAANLAHVFVVLRLFPVHPLILQLALAKFAGAEVEDGAFLLTVLPAPAS